MSSPKNHPRTIRYETSMVGRKMANVTNGHTALALFAVVRQRQNHAARGPDSSTKKRFKAPISHEVKILYLKSMVLSEIKSQ